MLKPQFNVMADAAEQRAQAQIDAENALKERLVQTSREMDCLKREVAELQSGRRGRKFLGFGALKDDAVRLIDKMNKSLVEMQDQMHKDVASLTTMQRQQAEADFEAKRQESLDGSRTTISVMRPLRLMSRNQAMS